MRILSYLYRIRCSKLHRLEYTKVIKKQNRKDFKNMEKTIPVPISYHEDLLLIIKKKSKKVMRTCEFLIP